MDTDELTNVNKPRIEDSERTRCEIWTRVMGYHRPVSMWNPGKQSEHAERVYFRDVSAEKTCIT